MVFSDTTNKNGIIQEIEFWTGIGDAGISGDATLLKQMTSRVNQGFDRITPQLYAYSTHLKWDDQNNTDMPIGTFPLAAAQSDYTIAEDDNSLDILNIVGVQVLPSATATLYNDVEIISLDDPRAMECLAPTSTVTGPPTMVVVRGNTLHFNSNPGYVNSAGGRILFEREPSYFASTDTTKEPGIPKPFHGVLPLYAAYDWLVVNKPSNDMLITRVEAQIAKREKALRDAINGRFRSSPIMRPRITPYL